MAEDEAVPATRPGGGGQEARARPCAQSFIRRRTRRLLRPGRWAVRRDVTRYEEEIACRSAFSSPDHALALVSRSRLAGLALPHGFKDFATVGSSRYRRPRELTASGTRAPDTQRKHKRHPFSGATHAHRRHGQGEIQNGEKTQDHKAKTRYREQSLPHPRQNRRGDHSRRPARTADHLRQVPGPRTPNPNDSTTHPYARPGQHRNHLRTPHPRRHPRMAACYRPRPDEVSRHARRPGPPRRPDCTRSAPGPSASPSTPHEVVRDMGLWERIRLARRALRTPSR